MLTKKEQELFNYWADLTGHLNNIICTEGCVDINNRALWRDWIENKDDNHWIGMLKMIDVLCDADLLRPEAFHVDAIYAATEALVRYQYVDKATLNMRSHKSIAWRLVMSLRELYNQLAHIDLPNMAKNKGKTFDLDSRVIPEIYR
jgi:hypothetical protein